VKLTLYSDANKKLALTFANNLHKDVR
jgi:hypothetical protein